MEGHQDQMYLQRDTHNRPMQVNADRGGDTDVFMYTYLNGKYQNSFVPCKL